MGSPFESFQFLDRGWDVRLLERWSLRAVFLWLLVMVFLLGMGAGIELYKLASFHRFEPWQLVIFAVYAMFALRYARVLYRRL
jgi:hypothetical protein